jgi:hypothetical protein
MWDCESRIERLEEAVRFYLWVRVERWLESLTREQLDAYIASDGTFPEPLPNPPFGSVPLDREDDKGLQERWEKDKRLLRMRVERKRRMANLQKKADRDETVRPAFYGKWSG